MAGQTLLTQLMPLVLETVQKAPRRHAALHLRVVAAMILPTAIQAVIDFRSVASCFTRIPSTFPGCKTCKIDAASCKHTSLRDAFCLVAFGRERMSQHQKRSILHDGLMFCSSKIVDDREPMHDSCFLDMCVWKALCC